MARHDTLAAVDLGSNSFHLQIGRVVDGQIYPLDAVRETVRLGAGLTAEKRIDRAKQAAARGNTTLKVILVEALRDALDARDPGRRAHRLETLAGRATGRGA